MHSADGNLCYFVAAHLTTLTVGMSLRSRARRRKIVASPASKKPSKTA